MEELDKYLIDEYDRDTDKLLKSEKRLIPIYTDDLKGKSVVTALEDTILQWKPRDLRLEKSYIKTHSDTNDTSEELLVDMASGMSLKVNSRNIPDNSITVAVMFQHNIAEFERYDDVVNKHNEDWLEAGEPEDVFDPSTGDIQSIKDRFVTQSRYEGINPFGESNGDLSKAKPKPKKKKYLELTYRLDIQGSIFTLGYVAKDLNNSILFYNELEGDNLAYLVRRSIQEMFGNPCVHSNFGPFYEGITMLINGKKNKVISVIIERDITIWKKFG